jgi:hypothetical protein
MKNRKGRPGPDGRTVHQQSGPAVQDIIETLEEPRAALLATLRGMALSLPDVEERTVYDGFCRHWTPAYYLGDRQLFHVHNFRAGLRATMFVGINNLEPLILDSDQVASELRVRLAETSGNRGTKQFKVAINSVEDAAAFGELVRVKWELGKVRAG